VRSGVVIKWIMQEEDMMRDEDSRCEECGRRTWGRQYCHECELAVEQEAYEMELRDMDEEDAMREPRLYSEREVGGER